jgi:carboxypeptidase Q
MISKRKHSGVVSVLWIWVVSAAFQNTAAEDATASSAQSMQEQIDLSIYSRVRAEGFKDPQALSYASDLADGIGGRLTGSPNMKKAYSWGLLQLNSIGLSNVHLEDWGEFGMGWEQRNTWVRMVSPDTMVFAAQAAPWSVSSKGSVRGAAVAADIRQSNDFDQYRGKLTGKIVLLGAAREVAEPTDPLFVRYTSEQLASGTPQRAIEDYYRSREKHLEDWARKKEFQRKLVKFLESERIVALVVPSGDRNGNGILFIDSEAMPGVKPWLHENLVPFPVVVTMAENYGRVCRLLGRGIPVSLEMNVDTRFVGDHEHGYNTIAEIPGYDSRLKDQVVIVGAHLDSWPAGTGAADDGAGVAIALESIRILKKLMVQPRRTIRIVLYSGEEQGLLGSWGYARLHFGDYPRSTAPDQLNLPFDVLRKSSGALVLQPEHALVSAVYNTDAGSGRVRGIYTGGNPGLIPIFEQWIEPLKDLGITEVINSRDWPADESSFETIGLPGLDFVQDPLDYFTRVHHSNLDTVEHLVPEDLEQVAMVQAIFIYNTAMRKELLPRLLLPAP